METLLADLRLATNANRMDPRQHRQQQEGVTSDLSTVKAGSGYVASPTTTHASWSSSPSHYSRNAERILQRTLERENEKYFAATAGGEEEEEEEEDSWNTSAPNVGGDKGRRRIARDVELTNDESTTQQQQRFFFPVECARLEKNGLVTVLPEDLGRGFGVGGAVAALCVPTRVQEGVVSSSAFSSPSSSASWDVMVVLLEGGFTIARLPWVPPPPPPPATANTGTCSTPYPPNSPGGTGGEDPASPGGRNSTTAAKETTHSGDTVYGERAVLPVVNVPSVGPLFVRWLRVRVQRRAVRRRDLPVLPAPAPEGEEGWLCIADQQRVQCHRVLVSSTNGCGGDEGEEQDDDEPVVPPLVFDVPGVVSGDVLRSLASSSSYPAGTAPSSGPNDCALTGTDSTTGNQHSEALVLLSANGTELTLVGVGVACGSTCTKNNHKNNHTTDTSNFKQIPAGQGLQILARYSKGMLNDAQSSVVALTPRSIASDSHHQQHQEEGRWRQAAAEKLFLTAGRSGATLWKVAEEKTKASSPPSSSSSASSSATLFSIVCIRSILFPGGSVPSVTLVPSLCCWREEARPADSSAVASASSPSCSLYRSYSYTFDVLLLSSSGGSVATSRDDAPDDAVDDDDSQLLRGAGSRAVGPPAPQSHQANDELSSVAATGGEGEGSKGPGSLSSSPVLQQIHLEVQQAVGRERRPATAAVLESSNRHLSHPWNEVVQQMETERRRQHQAQAQFGSTGQCRSTITSSSSSAPDESNRLTSPEQHQGGVVPVTTTASSIPLSTLLISPTDTCRRRRRDSGDEERPQPGRGGGEGRRWGDSPTTISTLRGMVLSVALSSVESSSTGSAVPPTYRHHLRIASGGGRGDEQKTDDGVSFAWHELGGLRCPLRGPPQVLYDPSAAFASCGRVETAQTATTLPERRKSIFAFVSNAEPVVVVLGASTPSDCGDSNGDGSLAGNKTNKKKEGTGCPRRTTPSMSVMTRKTSLHHSLPASPNRSTSTCTLGIVGLSVDEQLLVPDDGKGSGDSPEKLSSSVLLFQAARGEQRRGKDRDRDIRTDDENEGSSRSTQEEEGKGKGSAPQQQQAFAGGGGSHHHSAGHQPLSAGLWKGPTFTSLSLDQQKKLVSRRRPPPATATGATTVNKLMMRSTGGADADDGHRHGRSSPFNNLLLAYGTLACERITGTLVVKHHQPQPLRARAGGGVDDTGTPRSEHSRTPRYDGKRTTTTAVIDATEHESSLPSSLYCCCPRCGHHFISPGAPLLRHSDADEPSSPAVGAAAAGGEAGGFVTRAEVQQLLAEHRQQLLVDLRAVLLQSGSHQ